MIDETTPVHEEQAADFAALSAAANDQPGPVQIPAETQGPQLDEELAGMLQMLAGIASPIFPSAAAIYTPEICRMVGNSIAPVCKKHGWMQGGIGGAWSEEIMLLCVVGPLALSTVAAVRADIAAKKPAQKTGAASELPAPAPADQAPGQQTVTFGAAIAA